MPVYYTCLEIDDGEGRPPAQPTGRLCTGSRHTAKPQLTAEKSQRPFPALHRRRAPSGSDLRILGEGKPDGIVIGEVTKQILQPEHLVSLLSDYLRTALKREDRNRGRLRQMRQDHKEAEAGIARLLELVEKG